MAVYEWAAMTWEELRDLAASDVVAVLPVGAIEAHGPHLPLATDVIIAEAMASSGARRLERRGLTPVVLPAVRYVPAPFAGAFPGTIGVRPEAVTALVTDIADAVARVGVGLLAIANAHFDPTHVGALELAVNAVKAQGRVRVVFPDLARSQWAGRLTDEFKSGACHAGRYEGSIVLAAAPDRVRREVMGTLPANPRSLSDAIRTGKRTFADAGGDRAYFGWPADATAEEGRETIETLGAILEEAVLTARTGEDA